MLKQILDKDNGKSIEWIILARDRSRRKGYEKGQEIIIFYNIRVIFRPVLVLYSSQGRSCCT